MGVDWAARRAQLQSDGVCIIEDVLDDAMLKRVRAIAAARGMPINALVAEIDAARGLDIGLAGAIRQFVLRSLKERLPKAD